MNESTAATTHASGFQFLELSPGIEVLDAEYRRLLGFPAEHVLEGRALELTAQSREWYRLHGTPWIYAQPTGPLEYGDGVVSIGGARFGSRTLYENLRSAEAQSGVLVLVSAGAACEEHSAQLWKEEKPDEYLFLEMYGSAVAEHLVTVASGSICAAAAREGMAVLPHYSPGYTGWTVADQTALFSLFLRNLPFPLPEPVRVFESGMIQPKKSLLALFGLTRNAQKARDQASLVPCDNCALPNCTYRRAPFRVSRRMLESAGSLQPEPPLVAPKYSLNLRALKKWSVERLQLSRREDGSIEATFTYDGTTCSNMGRPLRFVYEVGLGPREAGFPILRTACAPAPEDTGHKFMCAWLKHPEKLQKEIAEPPPLTGQRLDEVLRWNKTSNPAGCFCEASARMHKWGLVLEVLHFALYSADQKKQGWG